MKFIIKVFGGIFLAALLLGVCTGVSADDPRMNQVANEPAADEPELDPPEDAGALTWSNITMGCTPYDHFEFLGRVTNETGGNIRSVSLTATFFDSNGRILGTAKAFVSGLPQGAVKTVDFFSTDKCSNNVAEWEIQTDFAM